MVKAVVVDDEPHIREDIVEKLQSSFGNEILVVGEVGSVAQGKQVISEVQPDLVFLDVSLSDGTGFDLIAQCEFKDYEVIFITGFDTHAIQAIKVGALDYILKPLAMDELSEAVNKAMKRLKNASQLEELAQVSQNYFTQTDRKRIVLRTTESVYTILLDDIIYCQSDGNYTTFTLRDADRIIISKPLKKTTDVLPEHLFVRCHQSYVLNKNYVVKYDKQGFFVLKDNTQVPVSTRRKDYAIKLVFG